MSNTAYIVAASRSAVGKSKKGGFRFTRPDDIAKGVIHHILKGLPEFDHDKISDVIVGNADPEAEHGLNMARMISLMSLNSVKVPGVTVNRYCASGIETIAMASAKIQSGMAECIIAGGAQSMSFVPMGGWRIVPHAKVGKSNPNWYWGMGLTAEEVAKQYNIKREDQDLFSVSSHTKALAALQNNTFKEEIAPIEVEHVYLDQDEKRQIKKYTVDTDEGPRPGTNVKALSKLKPVFAQGGSVTAGNSSQTSDGAAFVMVMSENMVKELNIEPIARLVSYQVVGVEPKIMGVGPVDAIPRAISKAGLKLDDIGLIELNEAFASQAVAVINEAQLNPEIVNVNGGAIALGHPLGCTGAKLTVQLINEMRRRNQKYGMVTMCVGAGQGAAGVVELLK
tara:strand:- start:332 stop:1516 length:1185 start_codon:yes stop_codon:yes gene_type:complete